MIEFITLALFLYDPSEQWWFEALPIFGIGLYLSLKTLNKSDE